MIRPPDSVFAIEDYLGGGADVAELGMIGMLPVRGMLVYTAGFTKGQPLTHLGAVSIKNGSDVELERAQQLGKRLVEKAKEIF